MVKGIARNSIGTSVSVTCVCCIYKTLIPIKGYYIENIHTCYIQSIIYQTESPGEGVAQDPAGEAGLAWA